MRSMSGRARNAARKNEKAVETASSVGSARSEPLPVRWPFHGDRTRPVSANTAVRLLAVPVSKTLVHGAAVTVTLLGNKNKRPFPYRAFRSKTRTNLLYGKIVSTKAGKSYRVTILIESAISFPQEHSGPLAGIRLGDNTSERKSRCGPPANRAVCAGKPLPEGRPPGTCRDSPPFRSRRPPAFPLPVGKRTAGKGL